METEDYSHKKISIENAGLSLFNLWMPRLFQMLDYLSADSKSFKNTETQIRAVFLMQYLISFEEKEYTETELIFNRLLVNLPMNIPLPKSLKLNDKEKQLAESMMDGIKSSWSKMSNASTKSLQEGFIHRTGKLEQQTDKWLLTVEERPYDILIDSLPWSFRIITYPWLEKNIEVNWK